MAKTIISADSHITEPPGCYIDHIDPKYRDIAPKWSMTRARATYS